MFVANVGDSRAILCTRQPGEESRVRPLSVDQTPFRKDERERIKKAGGHVLTIDQIEGLEVQQGKVRGLYCSFDTPASQDRDLGLLYLQIETGQFVRLPDKPVH